VSSLALSPVSGLAGFAVPGTAIGSIPARIVVREQVGLTLTLVTAARGSDAQKSIGEALGVALPQTPRVASTGAADVVWAGPRCWLIAGRAWSDGPTAEEALSAKLGAAAAIVDLSDSRVIVDVAGGATRELFAKGLPLDLHPRVFRAGDTAIAMLSHVAVQIWRVDDAPLWRLFLPRATAGHIWRWMAESAAEFGLRIDPPAQAQAV
jgi:methylglutamate dehydrogenase subunit D